MARIECYSLALLAAKGIPFTAEQVEGMPMPTEWKREKNWKNLDLRSEKLARARQPGIEYPRFQDMLLQEVRAAARKLP